MKTLTNYNSKWMEITHNPVPEHIEIIKQKDFSTLTEEEIETFVNFKHITLVDANLEDAFVAQKLYDKHKIRETELISADIVLPDQTGIINCRKGQEHTQIRF